MKKIYLFTLATVLTMPAFAESNTEMYGTSIDDLYGAPAETVQPVATDSNDTIATMPTNNEIKSSNPDIKFPRGMQFGLGLSATSGMEGFVGYNNKKFDSFWWKRLGVRLGYASTKPVKSFINKTVDRYMGDGIDIGDHLTVTNGKITAKQMFAVIDFYPFGDTWFLGGLRLSGGYYSGDLNVSADLTAKAKGSIPAELVGREFQLGDVWYRYNGGDAKGTATAKWDFDGPYAGLGFDLGLFSGLKIYFDAGVVFTDATAKLNLEINDVAALQQSTDRTSWTPVNLGDFEINKAQVLADAQNKLDKYPYYPIVKLGLMYRF
ncbi:MAG: hypothetical protein IKP24_02540 [Alphaproteobacteria bacterium]|nr:hypothetical protein [Alphaproteobacteria bacterium]